MEIAAGEKRRGECARECARVRLGDVWEIETLMSTCADEPAAEEKTRKNSRSGNEFGNLNFVRGPTSVFCLEGCFTLRFSLFNFHFLPSFRLTFFPLAFHWDHFGTSLFKSRRRISGYTHRPGRPAFGKESRKGERRKKVE